MVCWGGQQLEPSLENAVSDKLTQLGGLPAEDLRRTNRLKALDRIYQQNEFFTFEELHEIEKFRLRPSRSDPRPREFEQSFFDNQEEYRRILGAKVDYLFKPPSYWTALARDYSGFQRAIEIVGPGYISEQHAIFETSSQDGFYIPGATFVKLLEAGLNPGDILEKIDYAPKRREIFLQGFDHICLVLSDPEQQKAVVSVLRQYCFDTLLLEEPPLENVEKARHFTTLQELGVQLDVHEVVDKMTGYELCNGGQLAELLQAGADPDVLLEKMSGELDFICTNLSQFIKKGAHIDPVQFSRILNESEIELYKWSLLSAGVPRRELRRRLHIPWYKPL